VLQARLNINTKNSNKTFGKGFSIYKINGSTDMFDSQLPGEQTLLLNAKEDHFNPAIIDSIIEKFSIALNKKDIRSSLSFAWERDNADEPIHKKVIKELGDTEILVVIGYSFPFFNREVDRQIIKAMTNLRKVYFQAPDANNLIERFQAIREDIDIKNLIPKFDTEQFFLPNEL